ncbi:MAG: hypothetical protein CVU34_13165 [Betaproteobacteria bacterium HGW-Betaproteobacteria-7]|jgi:SAM-dependent methyltransferase|nr:MAG: hypothetical protein CVU34_13165 [Betaproteobacteria bacterium HGW-Betaproteobacteria-7]
MTLSPTPTKPSSGTCRACLASDCRHLHRQYFVLPGVEGKLSYDIQTCNRCGFIFADNIPATEALEAHYQEAEHHLHPDIPPGLSTIHRDFFDFIQQHADLPKEASILDIGCGMGHFLSLFKAAGHGDVLGLEPSRSAQRQAAERYGIEIVPETLGSFSPPRAFELITMCGVFEHIPDIPAALARITDIGNRDALLFLAVPDAASFGTTPSTEPFLEFALEHINFFTPATLRNLLERHGFSALTIESRANSFYNNSYIYGLFRAGLKERPGLTHDATGEESIRAYIECSNGNLAAIRARLDDLATRQTPTIIWGAGALATRLCATTPVDRLRLLGFVDKNRQLQGKSMFGAHIQPPEWLHEQDRDATVVVFSTTYGAEIARDLQEQFSWRGSILRIDLDETTTSA